MSKPFSPKPAGPQPNASLMKISPYVPGGAKPLKADPASGKIFKLSSNESPLGPSPAADAALRNLPPLQDYPDGGARALRLALGKRYGLNPDQIVCGAGSGEILSLLASAYLQPGDEAVYSRHGFLLYPIAVRAAGATPVAAPENDLTASADALLEALTEHTKMVFLANPNNPTGTYLPFDEVKRLQRALPSHVLLVLDAAYAEYVRRNDYESGIELVSSCENVVMTRTFSKIYGLANLRLGWAFGPPSVIDALNRIRGPFNVSGIAQAAGIAALEDRAHLEKAMEHNDIWLDKVTQGCRALGLEVTPSVGNFVLIHFPDKTGQRAEDAERFLLERGCVLRRVGIYGFPNALRMSIGSAEGNRAVLQGLENFLKT